MLWHVGTNRPSGGSWICRVKRNDYKRAYYLRTRDKERARNYKNWKKKALKNNLKLNGGHWCIRRPVVDRIIRLVEPNLTPADFAFHMGVDWQAGKRFFANEWVSERKVDSFLAKFGCEHLWRTEPFLDEIREALLEFERVHLADAA